MPLTYVASPPQASHAVSDEALIRASFDAGPFATLLFTPELVLLDANAVHVASTGTSREALAGRFMFDVFPKNPDQDGPDTETVIRGSVARVLETRRADEVPVQKHDLPMPDGGFERRYWRMIHSPIVVDGEIVAIRQDSWDVTATVLSEKRQDAFQRSATAVSNLAFWELHPEHDRFVRSPELEATFGFAPGEVGLSVQPFLARLHPADLETVETLFAALMEGPLNAVELVELRALPPKGETRRLLMRAEPSYDKQGHRILLGTLLDVTELRQNEEALSRALVEKEALLDDVNHRVKNSLQLVSSILAIGARSERSESARRKIADAADRVRAVAAVHASLYNRDDLRTVEFGTHLRAFCEQLAQSAGADERGIALELDTCEAQLSTDKTVALSLIVNELVTNAFKYAFAEVAESGATIRITLAPELDGSLALTVADNGTGQGPTSGSEASTAESGLGSRLIESLAAQVDGKLDQSRDGGWSTRLVFKA